VQLRSAWSRKTLLEKILFEMGIKPGGTIPALLDQICEQLAASRRPLILDEFDYCADKHGMIELVRDIYEGSQSSLLLVGEELPHKLKRFERFHGACCPGPPPPSASPTAASWPPSTARTSRWPTTCCNTWWPSATAACAVSVNLVNVYDTALVEGMDSVDLASGASARCTPAKPGAVMAARAREPAMKTLLPNRLPAQLEQRGGKSKRQRIWKPSAPGSKTSAPLIWPRTARWTTPPPSATCAHWKRRLSARPQPGQ
jgi:hypothetical protein